jgi:hypothetical protein
MIRQLTLTAKDAKGAREKHVKNEWERVFQAQAGVDELA